jgi:hypothetical protein
VYWLSLYPAVERFNQKVTLTIQHCAAVDDADSEAALSFITAKYSEKKLPHIFKQLPGGAFLQPGEGMVKVDSFSPFGIFGRRKSYYALCTYYISKQLNTYEAHISVTPNLKLNMKVMFEDGESRL